MKQFKYIYKLKAIIFFFSLFFLNTCFFAQKKYFKKDILETCITCKLSPDNYTKIKNKDAFHQMHYFFFIEKNNNLSFLKLSELNFNNEINLKKLYLFYCIKGVILKDKKLYNDAEESLLLAIEYGKKTNRASLAEVYTILGQVYFEKEAFKKTIAILEDWKQLYIQTQDSFNANKNFQNLGASYMHLENYSAAEENLHKSYALNEASKDSLQLAHSYTNLANLYYEQYKDTIAIPLFEKALICAKSSGDIQMLKDTYTNMAVVEENRKNYKASLSHRKMQLKLMNSIWNRDKIWELAEKDKEIIKRVNEEKVSNAEQQKRTAFIFVATLGILLLITIGFGLQLNKQKKLIANQKNNLQQLNVFKDELFTVSWTRFKISCPSYFKYAQANDNKSANSKYQSSSKNGGRKYSHYPKHVFYAR